MDFLGPYGWLFAVLGGAIILGLAIAWGMKRTGDRTAREVQVNEAGAREEYAREDAERPD
jgi:hypothetical protein